MAVQIADLRNRILVLSALLRAVVIRVKFRSCYQNRTCCMCLGGREVRCSPASRQQLALGLGKYILFCYRVILHGRLTEVYMTERAVACLKVFNKIL